MLNEYKNLVFNDATLQQKFAMDGYVVVPFLSEEKVAHLNAHYRSHVNTGDAGFYSSSFETDAAKRQQVSSTIEESIKAEVEAMFKDYRSLGACYLTKNPGPQSEMPIHQDWTMVNEPEYDSMTIWIALQDTTETNGAIQVIPGSHRFSSALRSPSLEDPFSEVQAELRADLQLLPMKAGEAFIFSQALLHASPANLSSVPRIAATQGLVHENANLCFCHQASAGEVEKYAVGTDFFQTYNTQIGQAPKNATLEHTFAYQQHFVTAAEYRTAKHFYLTQRATTMYKMIPIFKDADKQAFFEREGYAVFPLLGPGEVLELKSYYETLPLKDEKGFGFHVSMDNADKNLCREIRSKVWEVALPRLEEHLKDFKPFVASYVLKESNPKGVVPAHQDWSFVDREEDGYTSITCWIALVDTNLENGGMGVIRGSHKFMDNKRPSPSPQTPVPLSNHMFSIFPYLHTVDVKAGEVLMFDNRTFHASPPNTTDFVRLAAGVGVTQKDAQLVHYYTKPDGTFKTMLRYNVDEDFYLKYENSTLAKMYDEKKLIEGYGEPVEVPYSFPDYSADELIAMIKAAGNEYNIPMTEKLAKLFGYSGEKKTEEAPQQVPIEEVKQEVSEAQAWVDNRSFFEKYTPLNIVRELKKKIVGV